MTISNMQSWMPRTPLWFFWVREPTGFVLVDRGNVTDARVAYDALVVGGASLSSRP